MRIIVSGSRDWTDRDRIFNALLTYSGGRGTTLVHGDCPTGADKIADEIASEWPWNIERYPADWKKYGRAAGPRRNKIMAELGADILLAFPLGESRGTRGMIKLAKDHGIRTLVFEG